MTSFRFGQKGQSGHPGHAVVGNDHREIYRCHHLERLARPFHRRDVIAFQGQEGLERQQHHRFIVDDQQGWGEGGSHTA
jgi:hypothetical protein